MNPNRIDALTRGLSDSTSRRGVLRLLGVGVAGTAIAAVGLPDVEAKRNKQQKARAAKKPGSGTGTLTPAPVEFGNFVGQFVPTAFAVQDGALVAVGTLTGALGGVPIDPQQITLPVLLGPSDGSCEILNLVLGPLDLNLLGLEIHLDQIVLNITAQPGPGNLLGNLLCAIAGLLDGSGPLNQLVGLLNNLLRALGRALG